jgi:transposase
MKTFWSQDTSDYPGQDRLQSAIHSDGWKGYDGLVGLGYKKHHRLQHGNNEFFNSKFHFDRIENFWGIVKISLAKFRGLSKSFLFAF